jgi:uncharacterized YigZ family protein
MAEYIIPACRFKQESKVLNSRFIATISPAFSVDEAKDFISEIKNQYSDANHNVPVYLIGFGSSLIAHSNDDGEPSGTAGRPALSVLSGSGLGDTVLVITRYFGGTKLGTGGLVKAYGDSARLVIDSVPKAKKLKVHYVEIRSPYNLYEQIKKTIHINQGIIHEQNFTEMVEMYFSVPVNSYDLLSARIIELSSGQVNPILTRENQFRIKPYTP